VQPRQQMCRAGLLSPMASNGISRRTVEL
jgi:hypothetical protein